MSYVLPVSHTGLLLPLCLPVVEEPLEARIGEWVFKECLEYAVGHRADMATG